MSYPVDFGVLQVGLIIAIVLAVALLVSAVVRLRRIGPRGAFGRATSGIVLLVAALVLLWVVTLVQTYLGLSGEVKAARVVATPVAGQEHRMEVRVTLFGDEQQAERTETYQVEGDLWVLQANIVELEPWVNALGFRSGYKVTRLYGQRLDGVATAQNHIFLNGEDRDFFQEMDEGRWYTEPFVRSAYGNAVIATPGEFDVFVSRDAIKTRPAE